MVLRSSTTDEIVGTLELCTKITLCVGKGLGVGVSSISRKLNFTDENW